MTPILKPGPAAGDLLRRVGRYLEQEKLLAAGDRILVGVSGGPDSVALLHLLHRLSAALDLRLGVAHFDHGLRGRQSREEAEFVAALAHSLSLPYHEGRGDTRELARGEKISLQMAARRLRLQFLWDTCRGHLYPRLALGHTADDQVELFFLRLLRGAGPDGLAGMRPATGAGLVRPLLAVPKEAILAWLQQENLPYRQDPSNLKRDYLRNRVRLDLLPQLRGYNPRLDEAVWRTQVLLREQENLLAPEVARAWAAVGETLSPDFHRLLLAPFFQLAPILQKLVLRQVLQKMLSEYPLSAAQVAAVLDLARARKSGGQITLGTCRVARAGAELHLIRRLPPSSREGGTLPGADGQFTAGGWLWRLNRRACLPKAHRPREAWSAWLDRDRLHFPLTFRYFQPGDRLGGRGATTGGKVQDLLVDHKIPRWLRPYIPLVLSGEQIIGVAGLKVAAAVQSTPSSRNLLELALSPASADTRWVWEMLRACRREKDQSSPEAP